MRPERAPGPAEALVQGSPEPVLSLTASGRVLAWTRRAELAYGYSRAEAIGRQALTLVVPPEGVEEFQAAIHRALTEGISGCQAMRRRKDGTLTPSFEMRIERQGVGYDASLVCFAGRGAADATTLLAQGAPVRVEPPTPLAPSPAGTLGPDVTDALWSAFSPAGLLQRLVPLLVPRFADWCVADLVDAVGPPRRVAVAHRDPSLADLLRCAPTGDAPPLSPVRVLRGARPLVHPDPSPPEEPSEALARVGCASYLVLPLAGRTRLLGALTLVRVDRGFTATDVEWARELARRASLEMENALLTDLLERSRDTARQATERARQLQALSSALSEALTPAQVTNEAVAQAHSAMGACGGGIAMLSADHATFEVTALVDEAEPLSDGALRFPIHANYPLADAARSGHAVLLEQLLSGAPRYPYLAHTKSANRALAVVPLIADGRNVGALGLVFPERRAFLPEDVEFMHALARHAADALERARLYGAERSARALADSEARRSAFLADASRILSSSFDYRSTLESTAQLCVPIFADWCAVYLREKDGQIRAVAAVHSDPSKAPLARELTWRPGPSAGESAGVASVLRTGKPEVFEDIPDAMLDTLVADEGTRSILRELGLRWQVVLPLVARGRTLGALALCSGAYRRLPPSDLHLIEEMARRAALAVDNARLYHEVEDAYRRKEESMVALRESEERYRLLVDGATEYAIFLLDAQGRVASWNPGAQRMLGYLAEEIVRRSTDVLFTEEERAKGRPHLDLEDALRDGRSEQEGWRIRKDGTRYFANVVVTVLRDEKGDVRGFSMLHRDITERRRAREELDLARQRVAQHEKLSTMGTLVSGVAHEIRTPLTAIANSLHLLRIQAERGSVKPDAVDRHTALALEGVDRINALVQDLRRFKRIEPAGRQPTSLHEVVREALGLFLAAHRGRVEVQADLAPTPICEVDRSQLQQVVLNLLQNASEAMPHGGRVELATGKAMDGSAFVRVRDEGTGMTPEVKARMFEEFFTTKPEGTGLGLSIVRRILELHGGRIECDTAPGKGSTFRLHLPTKA